MGLRRFSILVALTGVLIVAVTACSDEVPAPGSPTPSEPPVPETPSPTPIPTPDFLSGLEILPLEIREPIDLPLNVVLIVENGCTQCDGPTTGFVRVYRDASGVVRTDTLFTAATLNARASTDIRGFGVSEGAGDMVVAVCTRGECGWLGPPSSDAQTTLFRSLDGGVTWNAEYMFDLDAWVQGLLDTGEAILSTNDRNPEGGPIRFFRHPGSVELIPPTTEAKWPAVFAGRLFWRSDDNTLFDERGIRVLGPVVGGGEVYVSNLLVAADNDDWLAQVNVSTPNVGAGYYSLPFDRAWSPGRGVFTSRHQNAAFHAPLPLRIGAYSDHLALIFGSADFHEPGSPNPSDLYPAPAVVDLTAAVMSPLKGLVSTNAAEGNLNTFDRNNTVAIQQGPFAKVVNTGACLNIRDAPDPSARVLTCASEGVLLRITGGFSAGAWQAVTTPAGIQGWASIQYLLDGG